VPNEAPASTGTDRGLDALEEEKNPERQLVMNAVDLNP
jgi:hypothetical protein